MSQISGPTSGGGGGGGTVTSVSGGNNITITGAPTVNPTVNVSGTTNHSVLLGNATASINSLANGTTGQILTAVTGLDPQWAAPAASAVTITGNTGGALGPSNAFTFAGGTTGLSFNGAGTTETLLFAGALINAGVVNIGTDATDNGINIGTSANAGRPIVIGNTTGTTSVTINAGSGGIPINTAGALSATINAGVVFNTSAGNNGILMNAGAGGGFTATAGGSIQLDSSSGNGNITIAAGSGQINLTNSNLYTAVVGTIQFDTTASGGDMTLFSGGNIVLIGDGGASINIGNNAVDDGINIGTGAGAGRAITIGNTTGTTSITMNNGSTGILMPQVFGASVGVSGIPLVIDNTGLLGTIVSSKRYKDNIVDMAKSSSDIMKLRPVNFTLKKDESKTRQWGLIAEEVAQIYPELVSYNKDNQPESVRYNDLPAMLLNEIQKLRRELDELKAKVK